MGCLNGLRVGKIKGILFSDCSSRAEHVGPILALETATLWSIANSLLWPYYDQVCSVATAKILGSLLF